MTDTSLRSGIRDNRTRGAAHEFLKSKIIPGSELSFVSAYFTSFAYDRVADVLDNVAGLRFLFGEPRFLDRIEFRSIGDPAAQHGVLGAADVYALAAAVARLASRLQEK